jgi:MEMO1 family protein
MAEKNTHPLVKLAKDTVDNYIRYHKVTEPPKEMSPEMQQRAGVFVCIKEYGELRGCIGTFEPTMPSVAEEIIHSAISAASQDPRFPTVGPDELDALDYTVDVLSQPEPVSGPQELDPKLFGVIVQSGFRRGLLLPDLEGVDTVEEQVDIARRKAGIGRNEPVKLYRFRVDRYT